MHTDEKIWQFDYFKIQNDLNSEHKSDVPMKALSYILV